MQHLSIADFFIAQNEVFFVGLAANVEEEILSLCLLSHKNKSKIPRKMPVLKSVKAF